MSRVEQTVTIVTCDGCGRSFTVDPALGGEHPPGYVIDVFWHHSTGGDVREDVFACRESCLRKAILNSFDKER